MVKSVGESVNILSPTFFLGLHPNLLCMGYDKYIFSHYQVVETDESVLDNLSTAESTGELATYSGLPTPSPPTSLDGHSPASASIIDNDDDDSLSYPRITHVQSVNIKVEPLDDNEDAEQVCIRLVSISLQKPFQWVNLSIVLSSNKLLL